MVYSFELLHHSNIRYREALSRLSLCELQCMLDVLLPDHTEIIPEQFGRAFFFTFESRPLSEKELSFLAGHSSIGLIAERRGDALVPLPVPSPDYLPEDLPEVLKYKGKTSAPFTRFMINTALSLTPWAFTPGACTLLDPLCGKGTSLFCAIQAGMNAAGLDQDKHFIQEADQYFSRYLKMHRLKHGRSSVSETWKGHAVPVTRFVFADTAEHFRNRDTRFLHLACGDTESVPALARHSPAHVLIADLPYGVQHAPHEAGRRPETFQSLLRRALPVWRSCLHPGGAVALSFNEFTLPSRDVLSLLEEAGFHPIRDERFSGLRHEVEQAVSRNVIFGVKNKEDNHK